MKEKRNTTFHKGTLDKMERAWWEMYNNPNAAVIDTARKFKIDKSTLYQLRRRSNGFATRPNLDIVKQLAEERLSHNRMLRDERDAREQVAELELQPKQAEDNSIVDNTVDAIWALRKDIEDMRSILNELYETFNHFTNVIEQQCPNR